MTTKPGEVYRVDLGIGGKVRLMVVVSREDANAPRALSVCAPISLKTLPKHTDMKKRNTSYVTRESALNTMNNRIPPGILSALARKAGPPKRAFAPGGRIFMTGGRLRLHHSLAYTHRSDGYLAAAGMGTGTMIAIGAGAAAAVGGVAVLAAGSGDKNGDSDSDGGDVSIDGCGTFTGTFQQYYDGGQEGTVEGVFTLEQTGRSITGTYQLIVFIFLDGCGITETHSVAGNITETTETTMFADITFPGTPTIYDTCAPGANSPDDLVGTFRCSLENCGQILNCLGGEHIRQ
jgi:hypothetical protein